ncbi:MAG: U32 family peptidase [Elusimicrobiales bacterium]|nr:U32 family peptidase [Elusimicrobiales bacterium]
MKIVSCFSDVKELEPLARAGADEFYTAARELPAFHSGEMPLSRLPGAIKLAHSLGKKISVAVNAVLARATARQLAAIEKSVRRLDDAGADSFIFASPYLLRMFSAPGRRLRARLHLSSVQPVFNSFAAAFFARFGVSRVILPSQLPPSEAGPLLSFCREKGIETEIFDYRFFGCAYVNGRCQLHEPGHYTARGKSGRASMCRLPAGGGLVRPAGLDVPGRAGELPSVLARLERRLASGDLPGVSDSAAFFDFFSAGVDYLKYGTRRDPSAVKTAKVRAMRAMTALAEKLSAGGRADARKRFVAEMSGWTGGGL